MIKKLKWSSTALVVATVFAFVISTASAAEYLGPKQLEPQLSSDGNTMYNAIPAVVYRADPNPPNENRRISPPVNLIALPEKAAATFSITYVTNGGSDPWAASCTTFPDEAKAAFNAAAAVWGTLLNSSVPITISACWSNLGSSSILGYSGGGPLRRNFTNAPLADTWYSGSLANALAGSDLDPSSFDMYITYNSNFSWYYGTDGVTPTGQYDLMSVVLHEIAHGLNFSGSMSYSGGSGSWGYGLTPTNPKIYDTFMRDGTANPGNQLVSTSVYANPSTALGSALVSNSIWFHGTNAMAANGGQRVKMYAPVTWASGSSYSHLDYTTFAGTANRLMVYAISSGVSTHDPGPVTLGILNDMGWPAVAVVAPTVTTTAVTGVTSTSATGGGNVTADGGATITGRGVCWSTSANPAVGGNCYSNGAGTTGAFTSYITGLSVATTYHVRAYATNSVGTSYGSDLTFSSAANLPTVTTTTPTGITHIAASSGGNVTSDGGASVTARGVCWSQSLNPVFAVGSPTCTSNGTGSGTFISSITGLTPLTTYHVRAYAVNSTGTGYGSDLSFTTIAAPIVPTVTTAAISGITMTQAAGGGNVTSDGGASVTDRGVCWSTLVNPTTADTCTHNNSGTGTFTSSLSGLVVHTGYHVRAFAINSVGTGYGSDVSFTTLAAPVAPTVNDTLEVTGITNTSANSGGNVGDDGGASVTAKGVCWSTSAHPTTAGSCMDAGPGMGYFTSSLIGLTPSTTYYLRAYATNSVGTTYGSEKIFRTGLRPKAPTLLPVQ
jgi:hypothetical protein